MLHRTGSGGFLAANESISNHAKTQLFTKYRLVMRVVHNWSNHIIEQEDARPTKVCTLSNHGFLTAIQCNYYVNNDSLLSQIWIFQIHNFIHAEKMNAWIRSAAYLRAMSIISETHIASQTISLPFSMPLICSAKIRCAIDNLIYIYTFLSTVLYYAGH